MDEKSNRFEAAGCEWVCNVTIGTLRDIQSKFDINLLELLDNDGRLLAKLHTDIFLLVDLIWATVEGQHEITVEEFAGGLGGDALDLAANAWFEGLVRFFRKPEQRAAIRNLLRKADQMTEAMMRMGVEQLEAIDVESQARRLAESYGSKQDQPA